LRLAPRRGGGVIDYTDDLREPADRRLRLHAPSMRGKARAAADSLRVAAGTVAAARLVTAAPVASHVIDGFGATCRFKPSRQMALALGVAAVAPGRGPARRAAALAAAALAAGCQPAAG
jgi:hypothetical protein